jgi:hypothetical protein
MSTPPPWKWISRELPPDQSTVWVVRIGAREPPFLATWYDSSSGFEFTLRSITLDVPWMLALKWRAQNT